MVGGILYIVIVVICCVHFFKTQIETDDESRLVVGLRLRIVEENNGGLPQRENVMGF